MIPAWVLQLITAIAYAVSKGISEAWLDALQRRSTVTKEKPDESDAAVIDGFRAAVDAGVPRPTGEDGTLGPPNPPPAR